MRIDTKASSGGLILLAVAFLAATCAVQAQGLVGALQVKTDPPGATVYVDGAPVGKAPCDLPNVPIGDIEVKAEMQGFKAAMETVKVEAGKTAAVDVRLQAITNVGALCVNVKPDDSVVELDRVPVGRTPKQILNVPAGTHRVTVRAEGLRPMYATVTIAPGRLFELKGKLDPEDSAAGSVDPRDLKSLGKLDPEDVPMPADLPEARAFSGVRKLLAERRYEEALGALDALAANNGEARYAHRIGRDRRLARRMAEVADAACAELRSAVGGEYVLSLRKGVRLAGTLTEVDDSDVAIEVAGASRRIPLASISAGQIIRLASGRFDPSDAANRLTFAVLHASEGEFEESYKQLRAAAEAGQDISVARSYVDGERLWEAAVGKERAERLKAHLGGAPLLPVATSRTITACIDMHRGMAPPDEFTSLLAEQEFEVEDLNAPFETPRAERPGLLIICDPGRPVPAYDRQELQAMTDFVRRGGGLVFIGRHRPPRNPDDEEKALRHPFAALLRWFGILVRDDELSVSDDAPDSYPVDYALCFPNPAHPVAYGVRQVVLPIRSQSLSVESASWMVLRTSPLVGSKRAGEAAPAVVAGREFGKGRVLVVANWPVMDASALRGSALHPNDARQLLANAVAWAAAPAAGVP